MPQLQVCLLGIPMQNLTLEEVKQMCLSVITQSEKDRRTHYLCPINSNFLANAHSWNGFSVRNSELLKIARESEISIATGKFLPTLSYLLGSPLVEKIKIEDLLLELVQSLGERQKAIFLFGGEEKISKTAAIHLHDCSPGLKIVGIATPVIYVKGEDLLYEPQRMGVILEQINEGNPDVLAINLGSPKEEIWYERVKKNVKVPLSIGTRNTISKLGKERHPTPKWMDKSPQQGWHYHFYEKIREISWAQVLDFFKMTYMSLPLIIYHNINRLVYKLFYQKQPSSYLFKNTFLFLSPYRSIAVISLPSLIDKANVSSLYQQVEESKIHDVLVFDFDEVHHIQPEGFGLLIETWKKMRKEKKEIYGIGMNRDIQLLMKVHRVWDFLKEQFCETPEALMARITHKGTPPTLYDAIHQKDNQVIITFFGSLDNTIDYDSYLERLTPTISQKDCILNFRYCLSIDNSGFIFLLKLRKMLTQQCKNLKLCNLNSALRRQFGLVNLTDQFEIHSKLNDLMTTTTSCPS